jgi:UDP-N-acetylglucosamine 2-epimerase
VLDRLNLATGEYALVTIHRAGNTGDSDKLNSLVEIMNQVEDLIVFPVHPRTAEALDRIQAKLDDHITVIRPVGYFDMIILEGNAKLIATDSGGVQREAYFSKVPCLTLRDETEWVETVEAGWNKIVGTDPEKVLAVWKEFVPPSDYPYIFGNGRAAYKIVEILEDWRG